MLRWTHCNHFIRAIVLIIVSLVNVAKYHIQNDDASEKRHIVIPLLSFLSQKFVAWPERQAARC